MFHPGDDGRAPVDADPAPQGPTSSTHLHSCDACSNAFFSHEAQLEDHIAQCHSQELFADYKDLLSAGQAASAEWPNLKSSARVRHMWTQIGQRAFALAAQRDGGEAKMREAHAARAQLELAVQRWLPTCSVYIFGSSVALGVWDGTSDVDFTVVDVQALEQGSWKPNEKSAVRSIAHVLFKAGFTHQNLEMIPFARVPIIKHHANPPLIPRALLESVGPVDREAEDIVARSARFSLANPASPQDRVLLEASIRCAVGAANVQQVWWDRKSLGLCATFTTTTNTMRALTCSPTVSTSNRVAKIEPLHKECRPELFQIDFDLSFRVFGLRNSQLLRQHLLAHPCGRPGSLVLKDWSKTSGVNNSLGGYFTSYAINILWIYFLVQRNHIPFVDPLDIPASLAHPLHSPDPLYVPMEDSSLSDEFRSRRDLMMGELLVDFFRFYAFEFNWRDHVVSLNRAEITTKEQLGWAKEDVMHGRRHTRYSLCIEDPYEENLNLGRHIGPTKAKRVMQEFLRGFVSLIMDDVKETCVFELTDARGSEELLPPATALLKLTAATMVAFAEQEALRDKNAEGPTTMTVAQVRSYLEANAKEHLQIALACWSFPQLLFRLGYTMLGGVVYRRGTFGRKHTVVSLERQAQVELSAPSPKSSASVQVRSYLFDRLRSLSPEAVAWTPASDPFAAPAGNVPSQTQTCMSRFPAPRRDAMPCVWDCAIGQCGRRKAPAFCNSPPPPHYAPGISPGAALKAALRRFVA